MQKKLGNTQCQKNISNSNFLPKNHKTEIFIIFGAKVQILLSCKQI